MFAEFMLDNTLRQHAVVITAVGAPLEQKYAWTEHVVLIGGKQRGSLVFVSE